MEDNMLWLVISMPDGVFFAQMSQKHCNHQMCVSDVVHQSLTFESNKKSLVQIKNIII